MSGMGFYFFDRFVRIYIHEKTNYTSENISKKANFLFGPNNMRNVEKTKIIKYGTNLTGGGFENSTSISPKIKVSSST